MTSTQWLSRARENRDALHSLIRGYHPQMATVNRPDVEITALTAESACRVVRRQIQAETNGMLWPTVRFDAALLDGDHATVASILSETWLGVPESQACWSMEGFPQCVDLLDEPPETDEENDARHDP